MIARWLDPLFRPFRELKSKWNGIKNVQANIQGDIKRLKAEAGRVKKDVGNAAKKAKEAGDKAKKAAGQAQNAAQQAQGAYGQAMGQVKSGQQALGGMMGGMQGPPGAPGAPPRPAAGPSMAGVPGQSMMGAPMGGVPGMSMPPPAGGYGAPMGAPGTMGGYGAPGMMGGAPPGPSNRTMAIMAGGANATAAMAWLVPLKGPQRGQLIQLKLQSVIGKDPGCDVVINDPFLSSRHATIRVASGVYILEDHSTNGTYVNDRKVSRHELVDSDFVKVGQTLMKFKAL
jgi:hypothetical protein